jgi:hypothetical protein
MADDDIVIIDAPDDEDLVAGAAPAGGASDAPADGIAELRQQLANEQAANQRKDAALAASEASRRETEQRLAAAAGEVRNASVAVQSAELDSIVNALAVSESELAGLQRDQIAAMEEGDFKKAADLNIKIGKASARQIQLEDGKTELERRREAAASQPAAVAVPPNVMAQQEAYIASQTPRVAAWMRANPRFFTDKDFSERVMAAHHKALGNRVQAESDEYFRLIDQEASGAPVIAAGASAQAAGGRVVDSGAAAAADQRTHAAAAAAAAQQPEMGRVASSATPAATVAAVSAGRIASAAPSRDAVNSVTARGGQTTVALTREEREFALQNADENDPDPIKTYARNKLKMREMGKTF